MDVCGLRRMACASAFGYGAFMSVLAPAFASYVERARDGPNALWRIVLGLAIVGIAWMALTFAALMLAMFSTGAFASLVGGADAWAVFRELVGKPLGLAATLCSFLGIWLGVWLAVRLLHGRALAGVLGAERRISWANLMRGLLVALFVSVLSEAAFYPADPTIVRSDVPLAVWLGWLVPLAILLLVQTSAEELVFRGYLTQSLGAMFRSPFVWAGIPTTIFTLLHWNSAADPAMNAAALVSIAAFALAATLLVYRTGDLGAAIGVHLGVNGFSILVVGRTSWLDGVALLRGSTIDTGAWSVLDAAWLAAISVATFLLMLWLLLGRRSPLRLALPPTAPPVPAVA